MEHQQAQPDGGPVKLVYDCATGALDEVPLTPEEADDLERLRAETPVAGSGGA